MKRVLIILGVVLLLAGIVSLVHPSFDYSSREEVAKIGPFKATVDEQKTAQIPPALAITLLLAGIALVVFVPRRK